MSDRSALRLHVYTLPEGEAAAFASVLTDLLERIVLPAEVVPVWLPRVFTDDDVVLGTLRAHVPALAAAAPGAVWRASQDPKYNVPGVIAMHVPALGLFIGDHAGDGEVVLRWEDLPKDHSCRDCLALAFGRPWIEALRAHQSAAIPEVSG